MSAVRSKRKRRLLDYVPGKYRPKRRLQGVVVVLFALVGCWILYTKPHLPLISAGGTIYQGEVDNGVNIDAGQTPVRVHGIDVGVVTGVGPLATNNGAMVSFKVNSGTGVTLRQDASFSVRWRTLLGGNVYIALDPGSRSLPPLGNRVIPMSRTSTQVELDQVLAPLNPTGRKSLQSMIIGFDQGLSNPRAVAGALQQLTPTMSNLAPALHAVLGTSPGDLQLAVASTSKAMAALSGDETALGGLIDNGDVALGVTAARSTDLASTLAQAPGALAQTRSTMLRLRQTLDVLDPVARQLEPGAVALAPAATQARVMLATAMPLLDRLVPVSRALRPAAQTLGTIGREAPVAINSLGRTVQRANTSFVPWLNSQSPWVRMKVFETIGPAVAGAGGALMNGDQYGSYATFHGGAGADAAIDSPCQLNIFDQYTATTQGLADCQLLVQTLAGVLNGVAPGSLNVANLGLRPSMLSKFLTFAKKAP